MSTHRDIIDSDAAVAERTRQRNAERSKRYREAKREEGKPDVKAVDYAISEAVSLLVSVALTDMKISVADILEAAVIVLVRDGARRSYARRAVGTRMKARPMHDIGHVMPSRMLSANDRIVEPPRGGAWKPSELAWVRALVAGWRKVNRNGI